MLSRTLQGRSTGKLQQGKGYELRITMSTQKWKSIYPLNEVTNTNCVL